MAKHPNASIPGHPRSRRLSVRLTENDHQRLLERAKRARARTPSDYVRAAALTGREFELPSHETQRELINAMVTSTAEIQRTTPGPARDRALEAAVRALALDRIVSR